MQRLLISLPDDLSDRLRAEAFRRRESMAQVVRYALLAWLEQEGGD